MIASVAPRRAVAAAYSDAAAAWAAGPERVYGVIADAVCAACPVGWRGLDVVDLGAGTGAATRAARRAGARRVVALDIAHGMAALGRRHADGAVVGDVLALPLRDAAVDVALAAFSFNHVDDPVAALGEAARVARLAVVASAYADDDGHPAKAAVEAAATAAGWEPPPWQGWLRSDAIPRLATVERAEAAAAAAGLRDPSVVHLRIAVPGLSVGELVAWRLGMAQLAPFVARLDDAGRRRLAAESIRRLPADLPPLVRSVIVVGGRT